MKKILFFTSLFAVAMGVITGCSEKEPDPVPPPVDGITLTLSIPTPAFKFDSETAFTVMASKAVESDLTVNLTSSNPAAATVPASVVIKAGTDKAEGKVTGVAKGKSTIKIEASGVGYTTQSIEVDVTEDTPPAPVKPNVSISTTFAEVAPGATIPFKVVAEKASENDMVINVTSSSAAATVPATVTIPKGETSVSGEITGVSAGEATIKITSDNATVVTGSITVTVKEGAATAVELSIAAASAEVEVSGTLTFTITTPVAPEANLTINVVSDKTNFATVPATVVLQAGLRSVTGNITGVAEGAAKITISAEGTTIKTADVNVTVIPRKNLEYCVLSYDTYQYAMLNYFKLGDVKVTCGGNQTYEGSGPLAANFEFEFNPQSLIEPEPTQPTDKYTLAIYADWNRTGKLTQVYSQVITAGSASKVYSGTITIPEDAKSPSLIRAVSFYSGEGGKLPDGCGKIESGSAVDFTYSK